AEPGDEVVEGPGEPGAGGLAAEGGGAVAVDLQGDGEVVGVGDGSDQRDGRAEGAGAVVDLGLGQIQRVAALDVAGADVVADRQADQPEGVVEYQGQLGLGHAPPRVGADPDRVAGADEAGRGGLEEQLGAVGRVDEVV